MKNIIIISIVLALTFSLCGCTLFNKTRDIVMTTETDITSDIVIESPFGNSETSKNNIPNANSETTTNIKPSTSSTPKANTSSKDNTSSSTVNSSITIKTEYFNVNLPNTWEGKYQHEKYYSDNNNFEYSISFYNKNSRENGCGGHLFTIVLTKDSDYHSFANGGKIGELKADKTYYLFIVRPSDVQFNFEYMNEYNAMRDNIDSIIRSISPSKENITVEINY